MAEEIAEALERPELAMYEVSSKGLTDLLTIIGPLIPSVMPPDPDDVHVIASPVATQAEALVTGDRGLLQDSALQTSLAGRGIQLLSPTELLEEIHDSQR